MAAFTIKDIQAILKALRYDDKTTRHKTLIDSGNKNKLTIIGENRVTTNMEKAVGSICIIRAKDQCTSGNPIHGRPRGISPSV